jgi:hypothetical protein
MITIFKASDLGKVNIAKLENEAATILCVIITWIR